MKILGEIKTTDTTASKTGNKTIELSSGKLLNISGTYTVGNSGAHYNATVYCIIDAYVDGQWINIYQTSQSRPARSSTTFTINLDVDIYATQLRVGYSSTDNETSKIYNITASGGYLLTIVSNPENTATIVGDGYAGGDTDIMMYPIRGYTIDGWYKNGSLLSSNNPYTLTVTENTTIVAKTKTAGQCSIM